MKNKPDMIDIANQCKDLLAQLDEGEAQHALAWLGQQAVEEVEEALVKRTRKAKPATAKAKVKTRAKAKTPDGEAKRPGRPATRALEIVDFISKHADSSPKAVADALGIAPGHAAATLARLVSQKQLVKIGRGIYAANEHAK